MCLKVLVPSNLQPRLKINGMQFALIALILVMHQNVSSELLFAKPGELFALNQSSQTVELSIRFYIDTEGDKVVLPPKVQFTIPAGKNANLTLNGKRIRAFRVHYTLDTEDGKTHWWSNRVVQDKLHLPINDKRLRNNRLKFVSANNEAIQFENGLWRSSRINGPIYVERQFQESFIELDDTKGHHRLRIYDRHLFVMKPGGDWISSGPGNWMHGTSNFPITFLNLAAVSKQDTEWGGGFTGWPDFGVMDSPPDPQETPDHPLNDNLHPPLDMSQDVVEAENVLERLRQEREILDQERHRINQVDEARKKRALQNQAEALKQFVENQQRNERIANEPALAKLTLQIGNKLSKLQKYQPEGEKTKCNLFVQDFAREVTGKNIPELQGKSNTIYDALSQSVLQPGSNWRSSHGMASVMSDSYQSSAKDESRSMASKRLQYRFDLAQNAANRGRLVVAVWKNRSGGAGHVAVIVPSPEGQDFFPSAKWLNMNMPWISQAGQTVFHQKALSDGFSSKKTSLRIFIYDPNHMDDLRNKSVRHPLLKKKS